MSRPLQYQHPSTPDLDGDEYDSDVDLDLDELDPTTSLDTRGSHSDQGRPQRHWGKQIPLKKLAGKRFRGFGQRQRRHQDVDEEEDLQGLLHEDVDPRDSAGSEGPIDDNAPLLSDSGEREATRKVNRRWSLLPSTLGFTASREISGQTSQHGSHTTSGSARNIDIGQYQSSRYPPNAISNAKYSPWSFLPVTLYNEFSFFFNLYFLMVALSQVFKPLRIGYLSTYVVPLALVLWITLAKEAYDDIERRRRDAEANKEPYTVLRLRDRNLNGSRKKQQRNRLHSSKTGRASLANRTRLDAIEEEEENLNSDGWEPLANIEVDEIKIRSRDLKVGDVIKLEKDQRVPADLVILKSYSAESSVSAPTPRISSESQGDARELLVNAIDEPPIAKTAQTVAESRQSTGPGDSNPSADGGAVGETFIRTDQLDGETDWKLRLAPPLTQSLDPRNFTRLRVVASKPDRKVNEFVGTIEYARPRKAMAKSAVQAEGDEQTDTSPLSIDNTAWANTVLASNATVLAVVVYTGAQTRQAMSTTSSRSKAGLLEYEINNLAKILCALTLTLSLVLVAIRGIEGRDGKPWYVVATRFLILFSTIVPISLRVNLDMGKIVYGFFVHRDQGIPGTVVRTRTIPEELGRVEYLLSDKTGTLTQNEMDLKKIHVGTVSYANEAMDEVKSYVRQGFSIAANDALQPASLITPSSTFQLGSANASSTRTRREIGSRVRDLVLALALCHNVTPSTEDVNGQSVTTYQASSPDEIAIVRWAEQVGLRLLHRDRHTITLQSVDTSRIAVRVKILEVFPFTSTSKRMGIILQFFQGVESSMSATDQPGEIWFYQKGADTVMTAIVAANDWLDEETANMAREGLRTLVVGRKKLSAQQYQDFASAYKQASLSLQDRDDNMMTIVEDHLEHNIELLGVTGVEDKLQEAVKPSLELLRNAGIKIWMLTGDKVETARCVAVSAKLVSRTQYIHTITQLSSTSGSSAALDALSILRSKSSSTALLIDGDSLSHFLTYHRTEFVSLAVLLPAVIACRCSPTQKADIANLIRDFTKKRVCCIGDGGNDVSMIQAADVGIGIVGKEGRQASLAADFSITQFHHLTKLLVWHGRNSYKRSAKLAQFIIHRGLIISVCQTFYSIANNLHPDVLYRDWLLVGYATVYTMMPVFSLVLDKDVDEDLANLYPELYKELTSGASLSYTTFFIWVLVSIYQGGIIQGCSQLLVARDGPRMVSVSFTTLILNELIMVAFEIVTWHWIMAASILATTAIYVAFVPFLPGYFDLEYMWSWAFAWRVVAISALSLIPPYAIKLLRRTLRPPSYRKVQGL